MSTPSNAAKGLEGVIAANTRLSDVKGDVGELIYCGYNINELAGQATYEEVATSEALPAIDLAQLASFLDRPTTSAAIRATALLTP